ncbi:unnamed protein product, partial [Cladocopium goreaui]
MEWSLFEDLLCFLQKEELVLKALRATNLKACLRTGTGTKGYEANAERAKHYRIYNKIEKSVTADQKATLMDWERRLCSEAEDIDFARLLAIFASREKQMRKPSPEACFNSNLSNTDKDLKFCRNFFKRKKTSMTDEQQKVVDEWEEKICGDGAGLCPAIEADFARFLTVLENREDDLRQMQKTSLEACFNSSLSNTDKDLKFCRNFFKRKKTSMTDEQQKVVDEWEEIICADGAGLCPTIEADFARLLTILENRQDDLRQMQKTSLEACFNSSLSNTDKDLKFCQNFFKRKKASMTDEQQKVVDEWEEIICADGFADFALLLTILENRQEYLRKIRKASLEACFNISLSNRDKDLKFCQNFFKRKKASMTDEQQKVVDEWEEIICADGAGLCPAIDADFARLLTILETREDDLRQMRKTSLEACFGTRVSNADSDLGFGRNFFRRQKDMLTDEQRKVLEDWSSKICSHEHVDDGFRRFLATLHARAQELFALRKCDLKGIFSSHICKKDSELKFCQNFWRRSAEKLSAEQKEQVEDLKAGILWPHAQDDRAALRPAVVRMLDKFENILARRGADFRGFGAASVYGLFTGHAKKSDSEGRASVLQHNLPAPEAELVRPPPIPPRPMRQPGVSSAALRLPKMPIILQPEDEVDLPETHSKSSAISVFTSRQLPSWLTSKGRGAQSKLDLDLELDSDEISELEKNHVNLKRRRTVQPWLESVDWIEDVSYRAALRNLQKQFYRGKTQEEEAWGFPQAVQHHRHERKKITNPSALDRVAERNLSKKMHGFKLQEPPDVASMASHQWPASRPCKSLGRGRPRSKAEKTMECIVANRGVHFRGLPDRLLYQEPSVATSGTEVTEVPEGCLGDFQGASALRRFRRKMLERFAGAEEA